jgi:photosystem II stability/assembly factor-like uncharacterized protein
MVPLAGLWVASNKLKAFHYLLITFLLLVINTKIIFPQWIQTNGPGGAAITSLAVCNSILYAGTYSGGLYLSKDNGSNWIQTKNGLPLNSGVSALAVNGNYIIAGIEDPGTLGLGKGIFLSTDNGISWAEMNNGLTSKYIHAIAVNGNNIFIGTDPGYGGIGGVYLSTDNGKNWSPVNNGLPSNLTVYSLAVKGNNIFAGTNGGSPSGPGGIYLSTNNGTCWSLANNGLQYKSLNYIPIIPERNSLISNASSRNIINKLKPIVEAPMVLRPSVFALTVNENNIFAGTTQGVYISGNDGSAWSLITDGLIYGENVYSLISNAGHTFAGTSGGIYLTTNYGQLWTKLIEGIPNNTSVNALIFNGNDILAGTDKGLFLSTGSGTNWAVSNNGLASSIIYSLAMSGDKIYAGSYNPGGVHVSTDNGNSWTTINKEISNTVVYSIAIDGNYIYAGTDEGLYQSSNYGIDWSLKGFIGTNVFSLAIDSGNVIAGTFDGIYFSSDVGETWSLVNNGIPLSVHFISVAVSKNIIYASGTDDNFFYNGVYQSTNNGLSWTQLNTGIPSSNFALSLTVVGDNILVGTDGAGIYQSTNSGKNWAPVNKIFTGWIRSLDIVGNNIFAASDGDGVFTSKDNGLSWAQVNEGLSNLFVSSLVISNNTIFAGTKGAGVWSRDISEILPVELAAFSAKVKQNSVQLDWKTSTEMNNYGFEIQRKINISSIPNNWEVLGFIKGNGNSISVVEYTYTDRNIKSNGIYSYRLKQVDLKGNCKYYNSESVNVHFINPEYSLENNFPNPFNPVTVIKYSLPFESNVKLVVYNSVGQMVRKIVSEIQQNGFHEINFDGSNLSSGVFYYTLQAASLDGKKNFSSTKKMILLK